MLVWMKQRTRWARGNNYAVVKLLKNFNKSKDKLRTLENLYMLFMSYTFLMAIVIAQTCMVLNYLDIAVGVNSEIIFYFWKCATLVYFVQLWYILSFDREHEAENLLVGLLMYFFYGYLWMFAILRSLHQDIVQKKARDWDKTARFHTELEVGGGN
jgi:cellulose synthase/poly-beta-1,6-N-acetylglucosamine synthase-like glycosyltransferase